jgi:hypothetical protein
MREIKMYSLLLIYEGSSDIGPVPICRVSDEALTRNVARRAIDKLSERANVLRPIDDAAAEDADLEADRIRSVLATI